MSNTNFERFSGAWVKWFALFNMFFWPWFGLVVGLDLNAVLFYVMVGVLLFGNSLSRKLLICFLPLLIYLFIYNSLQILHDYNPLPIHNEGLYNLEVQYFGVYVDGIKVSICEFFIQNIHPFLDLISGAFYITWIPFPILFAFLLFFKKRRKLVFDFWLAFLVINLFGFLIYVLLPAAPPWYYFKYGSEIMLDTIGDPAGLARFDKMIGFGLYEGMYSQSTNTFGALPSMHAAFPMVLSYYSLKYNNRILSALFILSMVSIWFAALYSSHHYVIDLLLGMSCAIIGIFLTELLVNGKFAPKWYVKTIKYVSKP